MPWTFTKRLSVMLAIKQVMMRNLPENHPTIVEFMEKGDEWTDEQLQSIAGVYRVQIN